MQTYILYKYNIKTDIIVVICANLWLSANHFLGAYH